MIQTEEVKTGMPLRNVRTKYLRRRNKGQVIADLPVENALVPALGVPQQKKKSDTENAFKHKALLLASMLSFFIALISFLIYRGATENGASSILLFIGPLVWGIIGIVSGFFARSSIWAGLNIAVAFFLVPAYLIFVENILTA